MERLACNFERIGLVPHWLRLALLTNVNAGRLPNAHREPFWASCTWNLGQSSVKKYLKTIDLSTLDLAHVIPLIFQFNSFKNKNNSDLVVKQTVPQS